jgi:acetyl esterase/lipase
VPRQRTSLRHELLTLLLGRLRRTPTVTDVPAARETLVARNREAHSRPPRRVAQEWVVEVRDIGFPVYVLTPRHGMYSRTLVHVHGGSFTAEAHPAQWRFATRLARRTGARLVFPAYPLAPEFTWRDSYEPLVDLVAKLCAETPLVLAGDSAGGGLALALAEGVRDRGGEQPTHLVLVSPWVDLTTSAPGTAEAGARDPWLNVDNVPVYAEFWAGSPDDLARPEVSPGLADLTGLPPPLMLCGTRDELFPACEQLAERATLRDWDCTFVVGEGLMHVYPLLPVPEARAAFRQIVAFLR